LAQLARLRSKTSHQLQPLLFKEGPEVLGLHRISRSSRLIPEHLIKLDRRCHCRIAMAD